MKFNLCTIRPKGFLHSSAFAEVKDSLAWALTALGHEANLTENAFSAGASTNILFGAELLTPSTTIPAGSILYNLEQPSHPNFKNVQSLALAARARVWDFSPRNLSAHAAAGLDAIHVPVGYTPNLTRIPRAATQDIDVCFLGWLTPRRRQLINDLKDTGLNVYASDCCYGGARDQILSRSKVALNVHHDGRDMFEIVRVSYLLANGKIVVSEQSSDEDDYKDLRVCLLEPTFKGLVDTCKVAVRDHKVPAAHESLALETISKRDYVATVAAALEGPALATPSVNNSSKAPVSAIAARYMAGCMSGDMKDYLPWLSAHAKGSILEIGTRDGASTSAFLIGLQANDPSGHLTSIDIDDCSGLWSHPQWTFIRGNSLHLSFVERFHDAQFDVILIDGDHDQSAYRGDLYNAFHWCKPGGLILTHDITPERGHEFYSMGIREEWDKFLLAHPDAFSNSYIMSGKYGLGVLVKK